MRYETALDTSGKGFTWRMAKAGYSLVQITRPPTIDEVFEGRAKPFTNRSGLAFKANTPDPFDSCKTEADFEEFNRSHYVEYAPEDRADLHRAFAHTGSRAEDALIFVNRHGVVTAGAHYQYLEDFFAAQEVIRNILQQTKRVTATSGRVEAVINKNHEQFLLRVAVSGKGKLIQQMRPRSLFGWMLLQAVRELTGSEWRDCDVCGTAFEVTDARQDRQKFCSDRCRQKHFRDQRRR